MIAITKISDLEKVKNKTIKEKIKNLLEFFLKEYSSFCADGDISSIGAILVLENSKDWMCIEKYGITVPSKREDFEWIDNFSHDYMIGAVVVDNDRSLNIIGRNEFFNNYTEER